MDRLSPGSGPNAAWRVAATSATRIHTVVGPPRSSVRIALPDHAGTLRVVHTEGERLETGRLRSTRRREVFGSGIATRVALASPPGTSLLLLPLAVDRAAPLGVVEIVAPTRRLTDREPSIRAIVDQSAQAIHATQQTTEAARALRAMRGILHLTGDLLQARTSSRAVGIAAALCSEHIGSPVAGVLLDEGRGAWSVAATPGLGARKRAELIRRVRAVPVGGSVGPAGWRLASAFAEVCGVHPVEAVPASTAVLLVPSHEDSAGFVATVAFLLARALDHRSEASLARSRNEGLDLGIAWTVHELQGPLVGARSALDRVIEDGAGNGRSNGLLERTRDELEDLAELVDPLLRWSAGAAPLRPTEVDLVRLVHEAVASCTLATHPDRVSIEAPARLSVRADRRELRAAVANLVRNALSCSPPTAPVRVGVVADDGIARVYIADEGPGVPDSERSMIFDLFARGRAGRSRRAGRGLGLFVARRIAQAHGGSLTLEPSTKGAVFRLEIPVASREGRQRSAS